MEESTLGRPPPGQVLVRTIVSAISAGTELLVYRGQAPSDMQVDESITALQGAFRFPLQYGYSAVGEVVELGTGVEGSWGGRLVFSFQPHQSHFHCPPEELIPVPLGISPDDAALLPTVETAVNFIMDGRPTLGEQVAVFGQGVVGLLTTSLLARVPLASLVTVDTYQSRRSKSMEIGANATIDPSGPDVVPRVTAVLQGDREYAGADLTYELSGNPAALDMAIAATGFNGRVVIGSWYGSKQATLDLGGRFHRSRVQLVSSQVSTVAPAWSGRWTKSRRLDVAWSMLRDLHPSRLVTHRFPVDRAGEAYEMLDQRPDEAIQVLMTYPESDTPEER